ncbi:hypothetical protein [Alicyclobacillus sp. ALC3]|uniref:hypothetical protein n=1 Tax=Alicyclobacillus sp. ALC3 TaxID=2796143 RepID=UPI002378E619|nr:hypothetical protein [Alicyclobacillus sp. ALC3]WDL95610.1 hypothetical protein JC200_14600 [Alicyclobacillus sp. ALC3]
MSEGVVSGAVVSEGVVSGAVVSEGVVSEGVVSEGVVSEGVVSEGVVSESVVSETMAGAGGVAFNTRCQNGAWERHGVHNANLALSRLDHVDNTANVALSVAYRQFGVIRV